MTIGFDIPWPAKRSQSPESIKTSGPQIGVPERSGEHAKPVFINTGVKDPNPSPCREIARLLGLSRNTVRVIFGKGADPRRRIHAPTSSHWMRSCCAVFTRSARAGWRGCMKSWSRKRASR